MAASTLPADDVILVSQSIAGDRDAFGQIVRRHQSMVCAIAYSATGNVGRSEDLAQETFITAWRHLVDLREPSKLKAWLCGIARNTINSDLRRSGREPIDRSEPLDHPGDIAASEPAPFARLISDEEAALLWREVSQLPEAYREPLVLFYREHQSAASVAAALDLTEDAVLQRLSRGRKQLQERLLTFVEAALERTGPDRSFAVDVQAALPALGIASQAGGLSLAKSAFAKTGAGMFGVLTALALPFIGMFAALGVSVWAGMKSRGHSGARRFTIIWNVTLWSLIGLFMFLIHQVSEVASRSAWSLETTLRTYTVTWATYLATLVALIVLMYRWTIIAARAQPAILTEKNPAWVVASNYIAASAWMAGFAWLMYDRAGAWLVVISTVVFCSINLARRRTLPVRETHIFGTYCHLCHVLVLLAVVNLRLHFWLSVLFDVNPKAILEILPMSTVHWLTLALLAWASVVWLFLRKRARIAI